METDSHDLRLGRLIERAMDRRRTGRRLDVESLLSDDPQYADQLAELLPVLEVLADLSSANGREGDRRGNFLTGKDEDAHSPTPIGIIGDYRIIRELGCGGMGVVYEAEQVSLGRRVALKVLPFAALLRETQLDRFNNEATAAARLQHGNIVPVYSVGCERGIHFYTMQLIDGPSLAEVIAELRQEGHPDAALQTAADDTIAAQQAIMITRDADGGHYRAAARIAKQVAEALQYAHDNGVLHRDIKPTNLLLDKTGHVWIADFGLARVEDASQLTRTGDLIGTLRYMSPEQAAGDTGIVDAQSDVYSLGATLYELTTLKPVFDNDDRRGIIRQVIAGNPVAPHKVDGRIPKSLSYVIARAMARRRDERYKSASEFADDLLRFLNREEIRVTPHSVLQPVNAWQRQHRWGIYAAAVLGVAIVALCAALLASHRGGNEICSTPQTQLFPDRRSPLSAPAGPRQRSSSRNRRALAVEPLEDRRLLTTLSIGDTSATEGDSHLVAIDRFVSDTTVTSRSGLGALVYGPDANNDGLEDLYAGSSRTHEVLRLDGISGTLIDVFVAARSGGLHNSADLKFGPDGHLYVTSGGTVANPEDNAILRYDGLDGHFIDVFAADLQGAISFDFGDDGDLYVANRDTNQILRFEGETGAPLGVFVDVAAGATGHLRQSLFGDDATGDGVRDLYVLSDTTRQVLRYDGSDGASLGVFAQLSDYGDLMWADFGPDGSMYVTARTIPGSLNVSIIHLGGQPGAIVDDIALGRDGWHIMVDSHGVIFSSGGTTSAFIDRFGPASLAVFTVQLSEASESPISVAFSTSDGTAEAGSDFVPVAGKLRFAPGDTPKRIIVPTVNDGNLETSETLFLNLSNPVGATIADGQGIGTILDIDQMSLFSDSFEHGQWNGLWVQDSQNDWFTSTQRKTDGSYSAEVDGSASDAVLTIASPINLTPYGSAELTFDWLIESGLDTGEYLALDLFNGTSWQEVAKLRGNVDAENVWHSPVVNIDGSYLVSYFQFHFRAKMSGSDEDANVDNVHLVANSLAGPPNQVPIAVDDTATTAEDTATMINVLANDSDPDLDVLQVQSVTQGGHGAVAINGNGTVTYTPQANYFGSDGFTYIVTDGCGGTDTASVLVTITAVNDAPVAVDDDASTPHDTPAVIDLLANDTDFDSSPLLIESLGTPTHGAVVDNGDGTVTYTPAPGYVGADSFVYVVTDDSLNDSGTVSIDVQADEVTLVYSNTTSTTIRDRSKTTSTINVPDAMTILDVNVQLTISHTRDQDLDVYLVSPDGTRVELFTDVGGNGDHFTGTILDDQASVSITAGAAPFAGAYRPEGSLAALNDRNALGTWTLEITDDQWLYSGTLHSWSITVTGGPMALLAAGSSGAPATTATVLHHADAQWAVEQAMGWWDPEANVEPLRDIRVFISDLPAGYLGLAWGRSLTLDVNANGAGWFVDTALGQRAALSDVFATASRQMDLLTVVAHEVGHLLGYDHSDNVNDVMAATLSEGTRRIPGSGPPVLPDSWEMIVASSLLDRASRLNAAEHELADDPLLVRAGSADASAVTDPWLLPLVPEGRLLQPEPVVERLAARILRTVADEDTELLDEDLLALLAASRL